MEEGNYYTQFGGNTLPLGDGDWWLANYPQIKGNNTPALYNEYLNSSITASIRLHFLYFFFYKPYVHYPQSNIPYGWDLFNKYCLTSDKSESRTQKFCWLGK